MRMQVTECLEKAKLGQEYEVSSSTGSVVDGVGEQEANAQVPQHTLEKVGALAAGLCCESSLP